MSKKVYRTAQGKVVDLGALQLQNEGVRAVGNMGVNARGDRVDSQNRVIDSKDQQTRRHYQKQVQKTNVSDEPVVSSRKKAQATKAAPKVEAKPKETVEKQPVQLQDEPEKQVVNEPVVAKEPAPVDSGLQGGLAAAIARAREIKQEPLKTPRQLAQEKSGVKKI